MRLGVSELAWQTDTDVLDILNSLDIRYIETVLPKHITWESNDITNLQQYLTKLQKININVLSTQSITYNSNVFSFNHENFVSHMNLVSDLCNKFHIQLLVLGAPKLRNKYNFNIVSKIFKQLDNIMRSRNQILLIEPNCKQYGGEYFFTVDEIVQFIKTNNFTNIKTMIDTHNIINEQQSPAEIYLQYKPYIKHIHVSENNLFEFTNSKFHIELANVLHETNYNGLVIYECINTATLFGDIKLFSNIYNKLVI